VSLTETFDNLGAHEIAEFIRLRQEENLHLDFKTVANANLRGADDKRNLAKCLSGFANSSGGIIVWGIDARKNAQGVDCASSAAEIAPLKLFLSRLNELTGEAVSPIIDGVRHKIIESTQDSGFGVTHVPESISGPYMAKLGEDRYYKRSGDSFYRMEHFDLEDMFGRRQKPHLNTYLRVVPIPEDYSQEEVQITLENDGRAIAKHVSLHMQLGNADITSVGGNIRNVSNLNDGRPTTSYTNDLGVIHPNGVRISVGYVRLRRRNPNDPITFRVSSCCENARNETSEIVLNPRQTPADAAQ
jgi:hypothetical protein